MKINPADLIPMDMFVGDEPISIDLVYAQSDDFENIFKTAIYRDGARLWAHKDIAAITLLTARILNQKYGYILELKDCLRTSNSQTVMQETDIVKANPQWMKTPGRLLAPPGAGAHPRAMAIDVSVIDKNGEELDMGTPFDHLEKEAARDYLDFPQHILDNRQNLEDAFVKAAEVLNFPFVPYASEWWDFRFPYEYYNEYAPLSDADLPPQMQMSDRVDNNIKNYSANHFENLAKSILTMVDKHHGNL